MNLAIQLVNNQIATYDKPDAILFNNYLLNNFIDYIDATDKTAKGYIICIHQFFKFLKENNIKQPKVNDIKDYKKYLQEYINPKNNKPLASSTKQQYLRAVKQLFTWLNNTGLYENVAYSVRNFKLKRDINNKTTKDAFNENDIKIILNKIDKTTITGKRDYLIILLMLTGGLRVNEIRNIDIQDIETIKNEYRVYILGKGHTEKDNYIKVIPAVYDAITDYLKTKGNYKRADALFTSTSNRAINKRITNESLSQIIKKRYRDAGYDSNKLTAHSLRHTSITLLLSSGADIYKAQMHARHQDPKTTEIYAHLNNRDTDTSEQDIYNQIFNTTDQNITNKVKNNINNLTTEQQEQLLNYITDLKGGKL